MGWIRIDTTLPSHNKIYDLSDLLKISIPQASGHMVILWLWASVNAPDGDLTRYKPRAIADAAKWTKSPKVFFDALVDVSFLDVSDDKVMLHNWDVRQELLVDSTTKKREKTKERVARYRAKKKESCNAEDSVTPALQSVTVTPLHNITLHNDIEREKDARACVELWDKITGGTIPRDMAQEIIARLNMDTDVELVKEGIRLSAGKANPAAYMRKCLQNWTAEGIKTYQDYCKRNKTSNAPKPTADLSSPETYADKEWPNRLDIRTVDRLMDKSLFRIISITAPSMRQERKRPE